jgi:hypothetical protein
MGLFDYLSGLFGGGDNTRQSQRDRESGGGSSRESSTDEETRDVREFGPSEFREEAAEFADEKEDFDFTVESLERLDEHAAGQRQLLGGLSEEMGEDNQVVGGMQDLYILQFGSYFGEVLVREFDGEWMTDGQHPHIRIPTDGQPLEVLPLDAAAGAVTGEEPQFAEIAAGVKQDIEDASRAAAASTPDPETELPAVDLDPEMDLGTAHERAVEQFKNAGYQTSEGGILNSVSDAPAADITKLFSFYTDAEMHVGVVYLGAWSEEETSAVAALLARLRTRDADDDGPAGVHVISARDPPPSIAYVSGAHPRGALALAANVEVETGPAFGSDSAPHYAEVCREFLALYFGLEIDTDDTQSLAQLDEFVLSKLRTVEDQRTQEGYTPREALLLVGALAGETMRRAFERDHAVETDWVTDEDIGVGLVVQTENGSATLNPVGKALKRFESGAADSFEDLHQTGERVIQNRLS